MRSHSPGAAVPGAPGSPRPRAALLAQGHPADALVPEDRRRDGVLPPAERRPRRASPPAPAPADRNGAPAAGERGERGARRRARGERPGRRDEPAAKETMLPGLPFSVEVAARLFTAGATQGAEAPMCAARPPMGRRPALRQAADPPVTARCRARNCIGCRDEGGGRVCLRAGPGRAMTARKEGAYRA